uniref:Uncharacterized protein n=1 Tax=Clastoptera arizonana TaxID=38151 RepID=A0A1B6DF28_9HEMI
MLKYCCYNDNERPYDIKMVKLFLLLIGIATLRLNSISSGTTEPSTIYFRLRALNRNLLRNREKMMLLQDVLCKENFDMEQYRILWFQFRLSYYKLMYCEKSLKSVFNYKRHARKFDIFNNITYAYKILYYLHTRVLQDRCEKLNNYCSLIDIVREMWGLDDVFSYDNADDIAEPGDSVAAILLKYLSRCKCD